jgi:hypothetical protein
MVIQFGSRDAEDVRLSGSHHEFQILESPPHGVMHLMAAHWLLEHVTMAQRKSCKQYEHLLIRVLEH